MTGKQSKDEALGQFVSLVGEILEAAEAIRDAANDHFGVEPEQVHWNFVGDATWTRDQLAHVLAVIRGEEGK